MSSRKLTAGEFSGGNLPRTAFFDFAPPLTKWLSGPTVKNTVVQKSYNLERNVIRNSYNI